MTSNIESKLAERSDTRWSRLTGTAILFFLLLMAGLLLAAIDANAQATNSPYSRFGYGLLRDGATAQQTQMGGVGYAMRSGRQVNMMNPASYAAADSMTFLLDFGLDYSNVWSKDSDGESDHRQGGGLDYITMQVPLHKNIGMSLGLVPYSSVGYSFGSEIDNGSSTYEGVGGLNLLYIGAAWSPVKGLSAGFNFAYLFGNTYNDVYANTDAGSTALFEEVLQVRDFHIDLGLQYSQRFNRWHRITAGVVYSPKKSVLGHTWVQKYDVGSDTKADTLDYRSMRNAFQLPHTVGAGLSYEWRGRLFVEADMEWQGWSKTKFDTGEYFTSTEMCDRWRYALGASWRTDERGGYLKRITWRAGTHFGRDYVMIDGNHVRSTGVSLGVGLPTSSTRTIINLGFEWERRQCHPASLLKEDYFNIRLGINFNQTWFMTNKLH